MQVGLMLVNGEGKGTFYEVGTAAPCSIGRDETCTICLPDKRVSKNHATISCEQGVLTITDQSASNGTFVNGYRVTSRRLARYDTVTIGLNVFRVMAADELGGGGSMVSLAADQDVIRQEAATPPGVVKPGGGLLDAAECLRGMQSIIRSHTNDIVRESLKYVFRMLPVARIAVFNVGEDGAVAQGYTVCRREGDSPSQMSRSFARKVLEAGKALLIRDVDELESRTLDASIGFTGVHCIIGLPIVIGQRITAVLLADNLEEPGALGDEHLRMMQFAGKAIEVLYQRDAVGKLEDMMRFLPVCDWCRRIRDDQGYWTQLESFVSERMPVRLARSCCPECAGNLIRT